MGLFSSSKKESRASRNATSVLELKKNIETLKDLEKMLPYDRAGDHSEQFNKLASFTLFETEDDEYVRRPADYRAQKIPTRILDVLEQFFVVDDGVQTNNLALFRLAGPREDLPKLSNSIDFDSGTIVSFYNLVEQVTRKLTALARYPLFRNDGPLVHSGATTQICGKLLLATSLWCKAFTAPEMLDRFQGWDKRHLYLYLSHLAITVLHLFVRLAKMHYVMRAADDHDHVESKHRTSRVLYEVLSWKLPDEDNDLAALTQALREESLSRVRGGTHINYTDEQWEKSFEDMLKLLDVLQAASGQQARITAPEAPLIIRDWTLPSSELLYHAVQLAKAHHNGYRQHKQYMRKLNKGGDRSWGTG